MGTNLVLLLISWVTLGQCPYLFWASGSLSIKEVWTRTCLVFSHFRAFVRAITFAGTPLLSPLPSDASFRMQLTGHHLQEAFSQQQAELGGPRP